VKLELRRWPPPGDRGGQQITRTSTGVMAIDLETGVAVFVCSERSQLANQTLAEQRLRLLLSEAVSPCGWVR
jgi:protein subunit release factor A